MPFQFEGIKFLWENNGRGLIADDMGLGKTLQALGWIAMMDAFPTIIVCPANGKYNWLEQIRMHTRITAEVLEGRKTYPPQKDSAVWIINYEIIQNWVEVLIQMKPATVVVDECHYIKNTRIKRTKACQKLAVACRHVIAMSGTPVINRPAEFFPPLNMVAPRAFSSFWKYAFRYCNPKPGWRGQGWDFSGASHIPELHSKIQPYMIRRTKLEVLPQLPKKTRTAIPVNIDNIREYTRACNDFLEWYKAKKGVQAAVTASNAVAVVKLGQLKRLAGQGKTGAATQWIQDFLEESTDKLVVFCYHTAIFSQLVREFRPIAAIGKQAGHNRQAEIRRFQQDPACRLYIGSIKADGTGITLTAASTVLFLELGWTPGEMEQAEDRINRIGQEADKLNIYYMLGKNTIDLHIWEIIESKRKLINQIIDGKDIDFGIDVGELVSKLRSMQ